MARVMTSYVLRVYRRRRAAQEIAGTLENPERDTRLAFQSFAELKALLSRDRPEDAVSGGDAG